MANQLAEARYRNPDSDPRGPYLLSDVTAPFDHPNFRYEWNGRLPPSGRSWRYSRDRAQTLEAEGRIVFSASGAPRLKRYLSEAGTSSSLDLEKTAESRPQVIVRAAMQAIARAVAENPSCLRDVEWRDLERVLREVFERMGFDTWLTRPGKDGGFDLRLECTEAGETRTFLVEVKHWLASGKKPGRAAFTKLFDVVAREAPNTTGLLLSSSGFTADVGTGRTEIEQRTVRLGGERKVVSLCQHYLQSETGLWYPTSGLADMLLKGTH